MLRVLGSTKRFCNGVSRRDALWAGGLTLFGLGLSDFLRATEAKASSAPEQKKEKHFGRAKSCILLYLYGSPSQLELADMKPNAPLEIRGELKPNRTSLPGCDVCELMPHAAKVMDKVTVLRSVTHKYPIHGVAYATTGVPEIDVPMELNPRDGRHWPFCLGRSFRTWNRARIHRFASRSPTTSHCPGRFRAAAPARCSAPARTRRSSAARQSATSPRFVENEATAEITKTLNKQVRDVQGRQPYVGISSPTPGFTLGEATTLPADITVDRLDGRKSLLQQFESGQRARESAGGFDRYREMAYSMIGRNQVREALDLTP